MHVLQRSHPCVVPPEVVLQECVESIEFISRPKKLSQSQRANIRKGTKSFAFATTAKKQEL
jgi:hypothetical protein